MNINTFLIFLVIVFLVVIGYIINSRVRPLCDKGIEIDLKKGSLGDIEQTILGKKISVMFPPEDQTVTVKIPCS